MNFDSPKIRQTRFIISEDEVYVFDVSSSITISKLKRMIIAAANLHEAGLRIFHEGTEYTHHHDHDKLIDLFPSLRLVEFHIEVSHHDEQSPLIELKFQQRCKEHPTKFPYFYCYTCNKSVCLECTRGNALHSGHEVKEKYDYLQNTKHLTEELMRSLDQEIQIKHDDVIQFAEKLNEKISKEMIPQLKELIELLENKMKNSISQCIECKCQKEKELKCNIDDFKKKCIEGLEEIRNEIEMENLMIDDNVFLKFDKKINDLTEEKIQIEIQAKKCAEILEMFNDIDKGIEHTFKTIHSLLQKFLKQESFQETLLTKRGNSGNAICHSKTHNVNEGELISSGKTSIVDVNALSPSRTEHSNSQSQISHSSNSSLVVDCTNSKSQYASLVCNVIPLTKQIVIFNDTQNKIYRKNITFTCLTGINNFLPRSSWLNTSNKLYICGGYDSSNDTISNTFYSYEPKRNVFKRLKNMNEPHCDHSMFYYNDRVYIVGGNTSKCEKYNVKRKVWVQMPSLKLIQNKPSLYIYNDWLYSFFGEDEHGNYTDVVQRVKLNCKGNDEWEIVNYDKGECDLQMEGCGIIELATDEICFLGGKGKDGLRKSAIKFSFKDMKAMDSKCLLGEKGHFGSSMLVKLKNDNFGNFTLEEANYFLKFDFKSTQDSDSN